MRAILGMICVFFALISIYKAISGNNSTLNALATGTGIFFLLVALTCFVSLWREAKKQS